MASQGRSGLRLEGAWLVRVGGFSTCGGGARCREVVQRNFAP